jgi:Domain of unknown function (DUF4386)
VTTNQLRASATPRAASVQTYARIAGVLFLLSFIGGGFGEFYAPAQLIVPGDATATAHNLLAHDLLYHLGFLAYLLEAFTDVALAFLLYVLLRPVHANLAFLAVLFRLMATATFAFGELFYFAPSLILGGDAYLKTFSLDQLNTLALLSFNVYVAASYLFTVHYGVASIIFGYLIVRSGFLPQVLGALWVIGGLGFVISNVVWVFAPATILLTPQVLASVSLGLWLLVRGVNVANWSEKEAAAAGVLMPS